MSDRLRRLFDVPERVLGFRGTALLLFALAFVAIGLGVPYAAPLPPALIESQVSPHFREAVWLVCAGLAVVAAFYKRPLWQRRGFGALMVPIGARAMSYLGGVIFDDAGRWLPGTVVYALFVTVLLLIAAWPEPASPPKDVRGNR